VSRSERNLLWEEATMARIANLSPESMNVDQRRIHDEIAAKRRGIVAGPFAIWLRNPTLADRANQLGNALRADGKLDKRLFELMVLITARRWSAQYEWHAHEHQARSAGLPDAVIEALRAGAVPVFAAADEQLIYDMTTALHAGGVLPAAIYDRALALFGLDQLIELSAAIGFYAMVAMTLNTFDAPVPGGGHPLPVG
jgi:4-carboxymuconolactone decarboxylase